MTPALDLFALASAGLASTPGAWGELLLIVASGGILGMGLSDITSGLTERFSGSGGDDLESSGDDFFGDGGDFDDGFGGDLGGDGFGDGLGDVDDWDAGDDGGDFDDFDDFGGGGGGGSNVDPRIEELENEVASLSSTMGTVRSENEAIQESVEDIEDNIRKLLEIYEMVTRGVNPFVDEPQGGGGVGGSFGLFDDAGDDGYDELDPEVADADPDSFFDDDFDDDAFGGDEFEAEDFDDASEDLAFDDDVLGDEDFEDGAEASEGDGRSDGDGKTFDELKSEYQSDDGWDDAVSPEEPSEATPAVDEGPAPGDAADSSATPTEGQDRQSADSSSEADGPTGDGSPADRTAGSDGGDASSRRDESGDDKPYLEALPAGYAAELLVVEWLTYLRRHSSTSEALRAIKYYETIGWVGGAAADSLQRYLSGLAAEDVAPSSSGGTQLTIDHHTNSLHYIGKLGGTDVDVERLEWSGPTRSAGRIERRGQRGIQR